jgi:hypothetical protein
VFYIAYTLSLKKAMNRRLNFKRLAKLGKIHYNRENLCTGGE